MALAGAERIFKLIDEEPEQDTGSVTLVNAKKDENGTITECTERTGMWAWKKPADEKMCIRDSPMSAIQWSGHSHSESKVHQITSDLCRHLLPSAPGNIPVRHTV